MKLSLEHMHDDYKCLVPEILEPLDRDYPDALRTVDAFHRDGDRSIGYAEPGEIHLNLYWFSRPLAFFRDAAAVGEHIRTGIAPWHTKEPQPLQSLTHEFGHCLRFQLGDKALEMARRLHRAAIQDPRRAPTGYSLVDAEEMFAECFMMFRLNGLQSPLF